jgi:hypothetical protein
MSAIDPTQMMNVNLEMTALPPEPQNLKDGFTNLIDHALNTNRMFQMAPLMMLDRPDQGGRVFANSADKMPATLQEFVNAVDRSKITLSVNDGGQIGQSQNFASTPVDQSSNLPPEMLAMKDSLNQSMAMMKDMNMRASLNNMALTYAMANFTVLDAAVKSVSGAIDTLSRAQ